jgi:predicted methyltransferase MtxX (methanogen marker protein 4)
VDDARVTRELVLADRELVHGRAMEVELVHSRAEAVLVRSLVRGPAMAAVLGRGECGRGLRALGASSRVREEGGARPR